MGGIFLPSPAVDDTGRRWGTICAMMASLGVISSPETQHSRDTSMLAIRSQRTLSAWRAAFSASVSLELADRCSWPCHVRSEGRAVTMALVFAQTLVGAVFLCSIAGFFGEVHQCFELTSHFTLNFST